MASRNTLGWYRCDFCGRKTVVYECLFNGRRVRVCPYCIIALTGMRGFSCQSRLARLAARSAGGRAWNEADRLISSLDSRLRQSGRGRSSSSRGRGRRR